MKNLLLLFPIFFSLLASGVKGQSSGGQMAFFVLNKDYRDLELSASVIGGQHNGGLEPVFMWETPYDDLNRCMDKAGANWTFEWEKGCYVVQMSAFFNNKACLESLPYFEKICPFVDEPFRASNGDCEDWYWLLTPEAKMKDLPPPNPDEESLVSRKDLRKAQPLIHRLLNDLYGNNFQSFVGLASNAALRKEIEQQVLQMSEPVYGQDFQRAFLLYFLGKLNGIVNPPFAQPDFFKEAQAYMSASLNDGTMFPPAAYQLGKMYEQGRGLPQSLYMAQYYYLLAGNYPPAVAELAGGNFAGPDMKTVQKASEITFPVLEKKVVTKTDCKGNVVSHQVYTNPKKAKTNVANADKNTLIPCAFCYWGNNWTVSETASPGIYGETLECQNGVEISDLLMLNPEIEFPDFYPQPVNWSAVNGFESIGKLYRAEDSGVKPAVFGGGNLAGEFSKYFRKPPFSVDKKGPLRIRFTISAKGAVSTFVVEESPDSGISNEAIRVLAHLGNWKPATLKDAPVDFSFVFETEIN